MRTFEAEWRARFERFGRTYSDEAAISGWSATGLRRRLSLFQSLLAVLPLGEGATVLELGCGGGTYVRFLAAHGFRAVGLDYSLPSLTRARAADPDGAGRYIAGEAYALPFDDAAFDLVVCIGVLQALGRPQRALDEMARVTRPGGWLVVEALNGRAPAALARRAAAAVRRTPQRVRAYEPGQVRTWLRGRGLVPVRQAPLCLPPRRRPGLEWLLDRSRLTSAVESWPGLATIAAHAFLFVAQRRVQR